MNLTELAVRRSRIPVALVGVAVIGGLYSLYSLPRAEDPGFTIRTALVSAYLPGADAVRVEHLVTKELERAFHEMPEVKETVSESRRGVCVIQVEVYHHYTDLAQIWDELRHQIHKRRDDLPEDLIGPIVNDDFGDVYGIVIGLTGEGASHAELHDIAEALEDDLLVLDDAAKVQTHGVQEERIFVEFMHERLAGYGLTPAYLGETLDAANVIAPGGHVRIGHRRIELEPRGDYVSLEELRKTAVFLPEEQRTVFLENIADIRRGYVDPARTKVHVSGEEGLAVTVSLREDGNIMRLGEDVRQLMQTWQKQYPLDIQFEILAFQPDAVETKINEFLSNVLQSVLIVCLVMLLFLGARVGLLVATLIPVTMLATFTIMRVTGIGLDQVSLASLIIALGILVDNAVVVSESIMVYMGEGMKAVKAAAKTGHELWAPLLTSSLTTAAGFSPIYLADSLAGEYTTPLFQVVTISLLCSWGIAHTFTPLLCVRYARPYTKDSEGKGFQEKVYRVYGKSLIVMLRHPKSVVGVTCCLFALAVAGARFVPITFFPPSDRATFTCELEYPEGTAIEEVEAGVKAVGEFMRRKLSMEKDAVDSAGVINWGAFIGEGGPRYILTHAPEAPRPEYAFILVNTTSPKHNDRLMREVEAFCMRALPDAAVTVQPVQMGPPVDRPVEIRVSGQDKETLLAYAHRIKQELRETAGARQVTDDWGGRVPVFRIDVDQSRARRAGLTAQDIAMSMHTHLDGIALTNYREGDELIPVILRAVDRDRDALAKLENLQVYGLRSGRSAPLSQIADVRLAWQEGKVLRRNEQRTVSAQADIANGYTARQVVGRIEPWLESLDWQPGYSYEIGGTVGESREANRAILAKVPVAAFIVFILLVLEFDSFRKTIITLLTIPLALIGVVIGLLVMRSYFGFMTLLGVISLSGIVINNGIVLIKRIGIEMDENGYPGPEAVVRAAQRRFRPILLTAATTIAGMIPLYVDGGPMWEPMAVAIAFGLLFSTVLTLGIVPVLFGLLFRVDFSEMRLDRLENHEDHA